MYYFYLKLSPARASSVTFCASSVTQKVSYKPTLNRRKSNMFGSKLTVSMFASYTIKHNHPQWFKSQNFANAIVKLIYHSCPCLVSYTHIESCILNT